MKSFYPTPNEEVLVSPNSLGELETLLGEKFHIEKQNELHWLLKSNQEVVKKKGEDWVKQNRAALLRQWEYVWTLL